MEGRTGVVDLCNLLNTHEAKSVVVPFIQPNTTDKMYQGHGAWLAQRSLMLDYGIRTGYKGETSRIVKSGLGVLSKSTPGRWDTNRQVVSILQLRSVNDETDIK